MLSEKETSREQKIDDEDAFGFQEIFKIFMEKYT